MRGWLILLRIAVCFPTFFDGAKDLIVLYGRSSALTSRAALIPDTIAPCIQPGHGEACSPANHALPSGLQISGYHCCWPG